MRNHNIKKNALNLISISGPNATRPANIINQSSLGINPNSNDSMKDAQRIWKEYLELIGKNSAEQTKELRNLANKAQYSKLTPEQQRLFKKLSNFRKEQINIHGIVGIKKKQSLTFRIDPITGQIISKPTPSLSISSIGPMLPAHEEVPELELSNTDSLSNMNNKSKLLFGKSSSNKHKKKYRFRKGIKKMFPLILGKKRGKKSVNINV